MPERYRLPREAEFTAAMRADRERQRAEADAGRYVAEFNERLERGLPLLFSPTIGAVLLSKFHWLQVLCSGCNVVSDIDLRVVRRNPDLPLVDIVDSLACQRCRGKGPMPRIVKLWKFPRSD